MTDPAAAPHATRKKHSTTLHGMKLEDPYFWLRERENPEVLDCLRAENDYTEACLKHTGEYQKSLYHEMLGRIKETDQSVPVKKGGFYYYSRTEKGEQYAIYCRKKNSLQAEEQVLLDGNILAEGQAYFQLGAMAISPDHRLLAYATDCTGSESYDLRIKDLESGNLLPETVSGCGASITWAESGETLFYNTLDEAKRPFKVFRHKLGTESAKDSLVFHEKDEAYFLSVHKSHDRKFLFLELKSNRTSEFHFLDSRKPDGDFRVLQPRVVGMEYFADHHDGSFYILTNWQARNFRLMKTGVHETLRESWSDVIAARDEVRLEDFDLFRDYMVVYERENGLPAIRVIEHQTGDAHTLQFPEEIYTAWSESNPEYEVSFLRYGYTSLVTPRSVYEYDMGSRKTTLMKQTEVLGGYDRSRYVTERRYGIAPDGTKIPMSIVYRKDLDRSQPQKTFLYGYGSYGITIDAEFSSIRLSLLDRGFIYCIAHIRGGGYLGRPWYENGKLEHKQNTFSDFITCARSLIQDGLSAPDRLVICGGSAGGLLMGAVLNQAPELFAVAVAQVPFVDVVNTMLDESLPLTVIEYEEWGNPADKEVFERMLSYSPYDNVTDQAYPEILIMTGLNDPRVQYWEPVKWAQKLRDHNQSDRRVLVKINMGAGHGGASGRYDYLKEVAFEYAFVFDRMGLLDEKPGIKDPDAAGADHR